MQTKALKYFMVLASISIAMFSIWADGIWVYAFPVYAFVLIPLTEIFLSPDSKNMNSVELDIAKKDVLYDWLLYLVVPFQLLAVVSMLFSVSQDGRTTSEIIGIVWSTGICCGVFGINVAHELGHRRLKSEQFLAKVLLSTSLYMHFFIEHNRGHHANVSTDEDPASSRRNEILYAFWFRSVVNSYLSAWRLENDRLKRKMLPVFSFRNEMLVYQVIQLGILVAVFFSFGLLGLACFVGAAIAGFLLLETVNYIEHYGLRREKIAEGRYERVTPAHSWNSNHPMGRLLLFELSRHSDHHYRAGRKYQVLRHMEGAPQMPTGYPGMMILSLVPPLWFRVMHRQIDRYHQGVETGPVALA